MKVSFYVVCFQYLAILYSGGQMTGLQFSITTNYCLFKNIKKEYLIPDLRFGPKEITFISTSLKAL